MPNFPNCRLPIVLLSGALAAGAVDADAPTPPTAVIPVVDQYFGIAVSDPYRWLEDAADPAVAAWNQAQNQATRSYLDALPVRAPLKTRLTALITATSPSFSDLKSLGARIFALYDDPQFQQPQLVWLPANADPQARQVVLDPNKLDAAGHTAIDWYAPSHDGKLVAVSQSQGGSEDGSLHVYDVASGKEAGDVIPRVQYPTAGGSLAWAADGKGFWYTRYPGDEKPESDRHFYMQVFFHALGSDWHQDPLVLGTADGIPRIGEIVLDNRYAPDELLASVQKGDGGEWAHWLIDSHGKKTQIDGFADKVVAETIAADHSLVLVSRAGAPKGQVLKLAPGVTALAQAKTLVPESNAAILISDGDSPRSPTLTTTSMLVSYIDGGPNEVRVFDLDGKPKNPAAKTARKTAGNPGGNTLPLGDLAAVSNLEALPGGDVLLRVAGYLRPPYFARWRAETGAVEETGIAVDSPIKFADTEVVRAFATSKDGTRVPLSILRKKSTKLDGRNPTLLYGYGGYGISQEPHFAGALVRLWLDAGGVYAEANIRGGAEYGERWHDDGRLLKKQNVFDDFTAAAESLIAAKYTDHRHLALRGGSNGGLLMGAVLTQHPALAHAVVSSVGIYDLLRVELDPNGSFNTTEFGSVKDAAQFKALHAYSPYHHVKKDTKYPALLMPTGANDGRVNPMQSRKFAAALQAASTSGLPILLRVSATSGHGIGSALSEIIDERADELAFLFDQLGMPAPSP